MQHILLQFLCCCFILLLTTRCSAQNILQHRIILIGDAGETNTGQQAIIKSAGDTTISGHTTVLFLGDNIYPTGMALPGEAGEKETQQILQSEFAHLRKQGAAVYFLPGNHDWDRSGPKGLLKVKASSDYLSSFQDSLLAMSPANGCPGPDEIAVNDALTIITFDSEWWLYPFSIDNSEADCACTSKEQFIESLQELLYKNANKTILLADHHPFKSYGRHGGYFSVKDHLFPLTAVNKNLYIPMPVVGSLYPLLRKTFASAEDLGHPLYKDMVMRISKLTASMPNVIFASGHEHTQQFIPGKNIHIVSGSGSKETYIRKGKANFATNEFGYVTLDIYDNKSVKINFHILKNSSFETAYSYKHQQETTIPQVEDKTPTVLDSITVKTFPSFNDVGKIHKLLFGENYRAENDVDVKLPILNISTLKGGLLPYKRGGGHQSRSLRLKDTLGKEWVLRSVEKYPEVLLPGAVRNSFAADIVKDAMSAQHPYSALVVPTIANAVQVPHANPIIGYIVPDEALGIYKNSFAQTLCLFEEREPIGKSDNTAQMLANLNTDNDNSFDTVTFFRARLLDVLLGDWDRHEDQWRWADTLKGKEKLYRAVPRDRDQVFHVMEGVIPKIISRPWLIPYLHNFDGDIKRINAFFFESRNLNSRFLSQMDKQAWQEEIDLFKQRVTDSVLESAIQKMPTEIYKLKGNDLLKTMQQRRNSLTEAMQTYYDFANKIVDIHLSDKNEFVSVNSNENGVLIVSTYKINKEGKIRNLIYNRTFKKEETKELRFFLRQGDDSVYINNKNAPIKMRFVSGAGYKAYNISEAKRSIFIYDKDSGNIFYGNQNKVHKKLSNDSTNLAIIPTNLYHVTAPVLSIGFNNDDGILLGVGVRHTHQGFRKQPYASKHFISFTHAFGTGAFSFKHQSEWMNVFGKTDFGINTIALAPDNTQNFFGIGNETSFIKSDDYIRFYRTRFSIVQVDPFFRWRNKPNTSFSIGPSIQWYSFDSSDNKNRFINNIASVKSYDSSSILKDKWHGGLQAAWILDTRNNKIIPQWGYTISMKLSAFAGLNQFSKSFVQWQPQIAFTKSINAKKSIIVANRIGGTITFGKTAFYQSAFLGGHDNLLGYRQYRFAGSQALYNNFELRIKLADFASYIIPGQFGFVGFWDAGRVWFTGEQSDKWHTGYGGGIYLAPAQMIVLQAIAGFSIEGIFPNISLGFRF